jgi:predicted CopG family antitoxin
MEGAMQKKLTITIDADVYAELHERIGRRHISRFIESLVRPYVMPAELEAAYAEMVRDEQHEAEAMEWSEGVVGDVAHDAR